MAEYISTLTGAQMDASLLDMAQHTSEAWAVGERNGVPVSSSDPVYNKHAKYWAQHIADTGHPPYIGANGNWYEWDGTLLEYVDTGVHAKGDTGNGISSTVLNADYTLTITFTDGTTYTTPPIRGAKGDTGDTGNGISSTVLNADYTLTITFTDGTSYTTPSIRGQKGSKGDTGDAASVTVTEYGQSSSSSAQPTTWSTTIPTVAGGDYLWTRFTWNNGAYSYTVARQGVDGQGTGDMLKSVYSPNYTGELASNADLTSHTSDTTIHVTSADKTAWNAKADKGVSFTVTLTTSGWSSNEQTVSDVRIVASGYDYIVSPQDTSYGNYASAMVYAEDITTDGQITFKCAETPSSNLTVNILKVEVQ